MSPFAAVYRVEARKLLAQTRVLPLIAALLAGDVFRRRSPVRILILSPARLAPDLRAPCLDVPDVVDVVDHLTACQQLAVVVPAVNARDEALDATPDVDGIVHDLPEMMTASCVRRLPF